MNKEINELSDELYLKCMEQARVTAPFIQRYAGVTFEAAESLLHKYNLRFKKQCKQWMEEFFERSFIQGK